MRMKLNFERILIVEPHPDDGIVGAGGTIARIKRENPTCQIKLIYMSPCTEDPKNKGHIEDHRKVCKFLGIDEVIEESMPRDSYLENNKQEVRDILWKIREEFNPDLVFCSSSHEEFHQDHSVVGECVETIFRDTSTILAYEVLRSSNFNPNFYVILSKEDVEKKISGIECYKSQLKTRPYFFSKEIFESHLIMRGAQAKTKWAESFKLIRGRV